MSLGDVTARIVTGGGGAPAAGADLVKTIVEVGCSTKGAVNALQHASSKGGMRSGLGVGPLVEAQGLVYDVAGAPAPYAVPCVPTTPGGVGSVTHTGTGTATITASSAPHVPIKIKCTHAGALGTARFRDSIDGGTTYGAEYTPAGSPDTHRVAGTFCSVTLTDAVDPFVNNSTYSIGVDGATSNSGGWKGTVAFVASPVIDMEVVATVATAGALGTAALAVSIDNGRTQFGPLMLLPASGVVVLTGLGVVLTGSGTFVAADTYAFPAAAPIPDSTSLGNALDALLADATAPSAATIYPTHMPVSVAAAVTLAQQLQTFLDGAFAAGKDWIGVVNCPLVGVVLNGAGSAIVDTADTRAVVKAAIAAVNTPRVSMFIGADYVQSSIGTYQTQQPRGAVMGARIATRLPVEADRSTVATRDAPLDVAQIVDDERFASVSLYDAHGNTFQTVQSLTGAYLSIERGGYGWQNLTSDAQYNDADSLRMICAVLAGFRPTAQRIIGRRYPINADGTIEAKARGGLDTMLNAAIQRAAGIGVGAQFGGVPQCSSATASVDPSSNLGSTGDKVVKVNVSILPEGFASAVDITLFFQGA